MRGEDAQLNAALFDAKTILQLATFKAREVLNAGGANDQDLYELLKNLTTDLPLKPPDTREFKRYSVEFRRMVTSGVAIEVAARDPDEAANLAADRYSNSDTVLEDLEEDVEVSGVEEVKS